MNRQLASCLFTGTLLVAAPTSAQPGKAVTRETFSCMAFPAQGPIPSRTRRVRFSVRAPKSWKLFDGKLKPDCVNGRLQTAGISKRTEFALNALSFELDKKGEMRRGKGQRAAALQDRYRSQFIAEHRSQTGKDPEIRTSEVLLRDGRKATVLHCKGNEIPSGNQSLAAPPTGPWSTSTVWIEEEHGIIKIQLYAVLYRDHQFARSAFVQLLRSYKGP